MIFGWMLFTIGAVKRAIFRLRKGEMVLMYKSIIFKINCEIKY